MNPARLTAAAAIALACVAVLIIVTGSGDEYVLHARFSNAGGLVQGGLVEVAGRNIGSITSIGLTPNGEADVTLSIDDPSIVPLHEGTRADIRAIGQGTIDNNYVLLSPGTSTRPAIPSGGILPETQTMGLVPLDALLDAFTPQTRNDFDAFLGESAQIYAGSGSAAFNRMLNELDPALAQLDGFTGQLALDRPALSQLVDTAAIASSAVASRASELTDAIAHTAVGLGAVAQQDQALNDILERTPGFLGQAGVTLQRTRAAVEDSDQALRDTPAAASVLTRFLGATDQTLPVATPVLAQLKAQVPPLVESLHELVPAAAPTVTALRSLGPAMKGLIPLLEGLRYYGTDFVLGFLGGVGSLTTAEYDDMGHYAKTNFVQSPQTLVSGELSKLLSSVPIVPGTFAIRTGLTRRCPGGAEPPAPDGSIPWLLGSKWCSAADDTPLSVDFP